MINSDEPGTTHRILVSSVTCPGTAVTEATAVLNGRQVRPCGEDTSSDSGLLVRPDSTDGERVGGEDGVETDEDGRRMDWALTLKEAHAMGHG